MTAETRGRRALLLTLDLPPARGGIQTMAREILVRAQRYAYRVIAPAHPGSAGADAALGVSVERVRPLFPGRRGYMPSVALAAARAIKHQNPDVVLAMHTMAAPGAMVRGVPLVVVCHGGELLSPRIRRVASRVLPRAARVVANSTYTHSLVTSFGVDPARVSVVPVGAPEPVDVEPSRVEALRARIGGRIVLSVSRLAPHKGHDVLIRSLRSLPDDVRLIIVGEGDHRPQLEHVARVSEVERRVIFAGVVSDDELPVYLSAADAFALLSRATTGSRGGVEGGGIALLEACAYGLPVVAGASGGIPDTIADERTGLLVDPEDPEAAARALGRVLDDGALAARLGAAARDLATGERSWARFVSRIEGVLDAAVDGAGSP